MKIVFIGNFDVSYSSESHHAQALEDLGHDVVRLQEGTATAGDVTAAVRGSQLVVWVHTHGWETPGGIGTALLEAKWLNIPVVTYHLDLWMGLERQKDMTTGPYWEMIDHFFTVDQVMAAQLNANTSITGHYLPAGVSHRECYAVQAPRDLDVVFVGSHNYHPEWKNRTDLIEWLRSTYGERFNLLPGEGPAVRGRDLNLLYARTKVVVGDSLCIGFDYPYYVSDRFFEAPGRGAFQIFPRIIGLEGLMKEDEEIVNYNFGDFDQLKEKIDYYLTHDDEREAIRRAGHSRVHAEHTYLHRWQHILKVLELS